MSIEQKVTPYYEYDLKDVIIHYNLWQESIMKLNRKDMVAYSIKANYDSDIINALNKFGAFFEVCSNYEYLYLIQQGINPKKIIHNGAITNFQELAEMLNSGTIVFLDSETAVSYALKYKHKGKIGIRCNIDFIKMQSDLFKSKRSRFGIQDLISAFGKLRKETDLKISYLQAHCAGNKRSPEVYRIILNELCNIALQNDLIDLEILDIGGGYKIAQEYWNEEEYVKVVSEVLHDRGMENINVLFEPGNALVRTSGKYVTTIIDKKIIDGIIYLVVDGSKTQLPFVRENIKLDYELISGGCKIIDNQFLVGASCKESDILIRLENKPELNIGDQVVLNNVGAYSVNEISGFLIGKPNIYYK